MEPTALLVLGGIVFLVFALRAFVRSLLDLFPPAAVPAGGAADRAVSRPMPGGKGKDRAQARRSCPRCGRSLREDARFCDGCGQRIGEGRRHG